MKRMTCICTVLMASLSFAGERLYNGIVLPDDWPPRAFERLTREAVRTPYLENRPPVVPIDVGRQLFVDDFLIDKTDMRREWHYPVKYAGNPILKPETPLEINRPGNSTARMSGGGLWWDPTRKVYRLWYEAGWLNTPAYAESDDGLAWRRVNLDVVPGTNRILPVGTPRFDGWVVTPDFGTDKPYSNWRLFVRPPGPGAQMAFAATSTDGLHWSELRPASPCGDASSLFYNPFRKKWIFSLRNEIGPWGRGGSRIRCYHEADDFMAGLEWQFSLGKSTEDVVLWLQPDNLEPRDPSLKLSPQLYDVAAVAYESIIVGGFGVWKGPENGDIVKKGKPKINDLCFAFSRDGYHFTREDRTPAVASERWDSCKWDAGYVRPMPNLLVVQDERILVYYAAAAGNTNRLEIGGFSCDLNGCYDQGASGVAIMRRDGFASMRPAVGETSGELLTRPIRFSGSHLFVNAALGKGTLRAEVADENGTAFPGYSASECVAVTGDGVKMRITWRKANDISAFAGKTVRLRFVMSDTPVNGGDLYSFWVSPSLRGESRGCVEDW